MRDLHEIKTMCRNRYSSSIVYFNVKSKNVTQHDRNRKKKNRFLFEKREEGEWSKRAGKEATTNEKCLGQR